VDIEKNKYPLNTGLNQQHLSKWPEVRTHGCTMLDGCTLGG